MSKRYERSKRLYERFAAFCEIPQDVVSNIPVFVIRGTHEIEISGCNGILIYDSRRIVLSVHNGKESCCICGDALLLSDFRDNCLFVRGDITSVTFGASREVSDDKDV